MLLAAARKLPEGSAEREREFGLALQASIGAPWAMAATAVAILELCDRVVDKVNHFLLSDLAVAADLATATARSPTLQRPRQLTGRPRPRRAPVDRVLGRPGPPPRDRPRPAGEPANLGPARPRERRGDARVARGPVPACRGRVCCVARFAASARKLAKAARRTNRGTSLHTNQQCQAIPAITNWIFLYGSAVMPARRTSSSGELPRAGHPPLPQRPFRLLRRLPAHLPRPRRRPVRRPLPPLRQGGPLPGRRRRDVGPVLYRQLMCSRRARASREEASGGRASRRACLRLGSSHITPVHAR